MGLMVDVAADPASGEVAGEVFVDADLEVVRSWLADPHRVLAAEGRAAPVLRGDPCDEVVLGVEHPLSSMVALVRWCPTDDGAALSLVESDELAAWSAEFTTRPVEGGVVVRYALTLTPAFRAPAATTRAAARREVALGLRAVATTFAEGRPADDLR